MTIEEALDRLFRARWELDADKDDTVFASIVSLDDELEALAKATAFDREAAIERWKREQEREIAEAHARYAAAPPPPPPVDQEYVCYASLIGRDVRGLWKDTEK